MKAPPEHPIFCGTYKEHWFMMVAGFWITFAAFILVLDVHFLVKPDVTPHEESICTNVAEVDIASACGSAPQWIQDNDLGLSLADGLNWCSFSWIQPNGTVTEMEADAYGNLIWAIPELGEIQRVSLPSSDSPESTVRPIGSFDVGTNVSIAYVQYENLDYLFVCTSANVYRYRYQPDGLFAGTLVVTNLPGNRKKGLTVDDNATLYVGIEQAPIEIGNVPGYGVVAKFHDIFTLTGGSIDYRPNNITHMWKRGFHYPRKLAVDPLSGDIFAIEQSVGNISREDLAPGEDLAVNNPAEELNVLSHGPSMATYGWPNCWTQGDNHEGYFAAHEPGEQWATPEYVAEFVDFDPHWADERCQDEDGVYYFHPWAPLHPHSFPNDIQFLPETMFGLDRTTVLVTQSNGTQGQIRLLARDDGVSNSCQMSLMITRDEGNSDFFPLAFTIAACPEPFDQCLYTSTSQGGLFVLGYYKDNDTTSGDSSESSEEA